MTRLNRLALGLAALLLCASPVLAQTAPPASVIMSDGSYRNGGATSLTYPDVSDGHARVVRPGDGLPTASDAQKTINSVKGDAVYLLDPITGALVPPAPTFTQPSFTSNRPNDTNVYAVNDIVANSTTAGSVIPFSWTAARVANGTGWVFGATLSSTNTALTNTTFVLHVTKSAPTLSVGDNGTYPGNVSTAGWICDITIVTNGYAFSDGVSGHGVPNSANACMYALSGGSQSLYGILETRSIYTPVASSGITITLDNNPN